MKSIIYFNTVVKLLYRNFSKLLFLKIRKNIFHHDIRSKPREERNKTVNKKSLRSQFYI